MKKDPKTFLEHILAAVLAVEEYTKGMTEKRFLKDPKTQDAVIRQLEIIGEAVKNLPMDVRSRFPNIPWKQVAGMRDWLIHEYFGVDLEIIWHTAKDDLPSVKNAMRELLKS